MQKDKLLHCDLDIPAVVCCITESVEILRFQTATCLSWLENEKCHQKCWANYLFSFINIPS